MYVIIIEKIGWYNPIKLTISISKQFSNIGDSFNLCLYSGNENKASLMFLGIHQSPFGFSIKCEIRV